MRNTYGPVRRNSAGKIRKHQGWDFSADIGTPCFAVSNGEVRDIYHQTDYGLVLVLGFQFQGKTIFAAYAHLSETLVNAGDTVSLGQVIARSGESGNAQGMAPVDRHLHFEVRYIPRPGLGLDNRESPALIFGHAPWEVIARHNNLHG
jgi:murein DD-endopeptidase MepM/ murein hydrolase activator NlpD